MPPYTTSSSGRSATSRSRLFISMRSGASVSQLFAESVVPRGALTVRTDRTQQRAHRGDAFALQSLEVRVRIAIRYRIALAHLLEHARSHELHRGIGAAAQEADRAVLVRQVLGEVGVERHAIERRCARAMARLGSLARCADQHL